MARFYNGWEDVFLPEFEKQYFKDLKEFLVSEYSAKTIYPPKSQIFHAFDITSPEDASVVILGQDPYIGFGQAHGLAFSVPDGVLVPQSLQNIKKEIESDLGRKSAIANGNLTPWAEQGVLLLNTVMTVEHGLSNSHANRGWETFTDKVIESLNNRERPLVFMLWGNNAISKRYKIKNPNHLILTAPHPSPLSAYRGFFGCKHFSQANAFLAPQFREIKW